MEKKEDELKEFEQQFINVAGSIKASIDKNMLGILTKNLRLSFKTITL